MFQVDRIREQLAMIGLAHIPEEAIQAFVSEELDRLYPPPFTVGKPSLHALSEGTSDHFSDKDEPWREAGFKRKVVSDVSRCWTWFPFSLLDGPQWSIAHTPWCFAA